MKHRVVEGGYLLVLQRGEELHKSLMSFCEQNSVKSAWLSGLGGVTEATLGYYDLKAREYKFHKFTKLVELLGLQGNVALLNGKLLMHLHVAVAAADLRTYGGHLKEAVVGGTCEILIRVFSEQLQRKLDSKTGLNLLEP